MKKAIMDGGDEDTQLRVIDTCIKQMADLNYALMSDSIYRVADEDNGLNIVCNTVEDKKNILELLRNVGASDIAAIDEKINIINNIGVSNKMDATCGECGNQWEAVMNLNPVNFFTTS